MHIEMTVISACYSAHSLHSIGIGRHLSLQVAAAGEAILKDQVLGFATHARSMTNVTLESMEIEGYGPFKCALADESAQTNS